MTKAQALALEERVFRCIRAENLVSAGQTLVVAVSGGPDSVCLAKILSRLYTRLEIKLHLAHLDHALRGGEAEADAEYVADLAAKLGFPCTAARRDVRAYQKGRRLSLEEAAREVRYQFLLETVRQVQAAAVAVGHTRNDQVETILLHILRGAGTLGLVGLRPRQALQIGEHRLKLVRPLLALTREETEAYCQHYRLAPREDRSNRSRRMLRNRVRLELLPLLRSYNPAFSRSLLRLSRIVTEDLKHLEDEAESLFPTLATRSGSGFELEKARFGSLDKALQRQVLRRAILLVCGTLKDVEDRHIEGILRALKKPAGRRLDLPYGLVFRLDYASYHLGPPEPEPRPVSALQTGFPLEIPGTIRLPGWQVEAGIGAAARIDARANNDPFLGYFDADLTGTEISLRSPRRGETFQPLGMKSAKKVAAFLLDAHVPRRLRSTVPVLATPQAVIWLVGQRIDERFKVSPATRRVLRLRLQKID